jgi:hypothetical protein
MTACGWLGSLLASAGPGMPGPYKAAVRCNR